MQKYGIRCIFTNIFNTIYLLLFQLFASRLNVKQRTNSSHKSALRFISTYVGNVLHICGKRFAHMWEMFPTIVELKSRLRQIKLSLINFKLNQPTDNYD